MLRRHRAILIGNAAALVVSVLLSLVLIPPMQAQGAAVAVVLAEFTLAGVLVLQLVRARPDLQDALLRRPIAILGMGAGSGAVAFITGLPAVAMVTLGVLVFAALLLVTGYLPPEIRELLSRTGRSEQA